MYILGKLARCVKRYDLVNEIRGEGNLLKWHEDQICSAKDRMMRAAECQLKAGRRKRNEIVKAQESRGS